ncbi:hypothetical protein GOV07_01245 [Candidatus Woesearchaeota archaeon]|nr:hypothetical protein [Candidatus Woesearchaeota archaeon]
MSTIIRDSRIHRDCQDFLRDKIKTALRTGDFPHLKWAKPKSNGYKTKPIIFPRIFVRGPVIYENGPSITYGCQEIFYLIHATFLEKEFEAGINYYTPEDVEGRTALRTVVSQDLVDLAQLRKTGINDCLGFYNLRMNRRLREADFEGFAATMLEGLEHFAEELYGHFHSA